MIRILIVDDEYLIRDLIKDSLDYRELGYDIVGEAEDGRDALEKIEKLNPQVIILDINIPFINGIELSKIIRVKYPDIKIIILTGYSEFEYAKECVKIGVSDYLLKPILVEELQKILLEIKQEIFKENKHNQYMDILENNVKKVRNTLMEQFLNQLILENTFSQEYIKEQLQKCEISLSENSLMVACIQIDNINTIWDIEEDRRLWRFAVHNISSEILCELTSGEVFFGTERVIVYTANYQEGVKQSLDKIVSIVHELLSFSVTIGVGRIYDGYDKIHQSYSEAMEAVNEKFYQGCEKVIEYSEKLSKQKGKEVFINQFDQDIMILMRTGDSEAYTNFIQNLRQGIINSRPSFKNIYKIYGDIASEIIRYILENNINPEDIFPQHEHDIEYISSRETIFELHEWALMLFDKTVREVNRMKMTKTAYIVERARTYIEENCGKQDISLDEISERIFINPSYLSKVFKRETKYSVIEYLTNFRMKKAKELMDNNPDMKIGNIASKVGYYDPFYFSKLFKKSYGVSPSKYMSKR